MSSTSRRVLLTRPVYNRKPVLSGSTTSLAHADAHVRTTRSEPLVERARVASDTSACADTHAKQLLGKLSDEQKQELLDSLLAEKMLNSTAAGNDREVTLWTEAVHRALVASVGSMGGSVAGPGLLRKVLRVGTVWEPVQTFMRAARFTDLPVNERQRAYNLVADLLVKYARTAARRSGAPLSPKLIANCTQNVAGVFENAFPGYVEAGLARMVVRAQQVA